MIRLASDITVPASIDNAFVKPKRVTDVATTLYVYDHCPFCVRVRLALGLKNIKHNLHFLANDDVKTPTDLVGKKIAPIFVSDRDWKRRIEVLLALRNCFSHFGLLTLWLFMGCSGNKKCNFSGMP